VILAGVMLKLGTYGLVRVNLQMLPDAFAEYALVVAIIGLVSVMWGALVAMAQRDLKRMIAYTSINHMGYVIVGVAAAAAATSAETARLALDGAVLQMVAHGIVTGLLHRRLHRVACEDPRPRRARGAHAPDAGLRDRGRRRVLRLPRAAGTRAIPR
jgi:NADH:ubiquinone oxidoreductase subunit 4 (subunit M)